MLATCMSYGACCTQLGAVRWQPTATGLMGLVGPSLGLHVGNLQVLWGLLESFGLYVGNLHVLWGLLGPAWGCILATYMSYGACWTQLGGCMLATYMSYVACCTQLEAVCWQPTGLMGLVGA